MNDEPIATLEDLPWTDWIAVGTPTRFGDVAAQLKDVPRPSRRTVGASREADQQGGDVVHLLTDGPQGQASTILALNNTFCHWGAIVLRGGTRLRRYSTARGNPQGASYTSGTRVGQRVIERAGRPIPNADRLSAAALWHRLLAEISSERHGAGLISKLPVDGALWLARAQSIWRDAARVVSIRWDVFLRFEPQTRAFAFAAYLAALDAEQTAAVRMSRLAPSTTR